MSFCQSLVESYPSIIIIETKQARCLHSCYFAGAMPSVINLLQAASQLSPMRILPSRTNWSTVHLETGGLTSNS